MPHAPLVFLAAQAVVASSAAAAGALYLLDTGNSSPVDAVWLYKVNPATAAVISQVQLGSPGPGLTILQASALARQPATGLFFVEITVSDTMFVFSERLMRVNPQTGALTFVAMLPRASFDDFTFLPGGALIAARASAGGVGDFDDSIFSVSPVTGAETFLGGNPHRDYPSIAGFSNNSVFLTQTRDDVLRLFMLDLNGFAGVSDIFQTHTLTNGFEILALARRPSDGAVFATTHDNNLWALNPATQGQQFLGNMEESSVKGLAFVGGVLYGLTNPNAFGSFDDPRLVTLSTTTGATLTSVAVTMPGRSLIRGVGLATQPGTGALFAIVGENAQPRLLCTINPTTGVAAQIGPETDLRLAGLAFDSQSSLLAVTGDGDPVIPCALFRIDTTTGSQTFLRFLGDGARGEAITNGSPGLLFHASGGEPGQQFFENVSLVIGVPRLLTPVSYTPAGAPFLAPSLEALAYSQSAQTLAGCADDRLYIFDLNAQTLTNVGAVVNAQAPPGRSIRLSAAVFDEPLTVPCPGDANGDRHVDFIDLNIVLSDFGQAGALPGDLNHDGVVDFLDLNLVLSFFGTNC